MYAGMYVCVYACVCIHVCSAYVCMYACFCVRHVHVFLGVYRGVHVGVRVGVCTCVHVRSFDRFRACLHFAEAHTVYGTVIVNVLKSCRYISIKSVLVQTSDMDNYPSREPCMLMSCSIEHIRKLIKKVLAVCRMESIRHQKM